MKLNTATIIGLIVAVIVLSLIGTCNFKKANNISEEKAKLQTELDNAARLIDSLSVEASQKDTITVVQAIEKEVWRTRTVSGPSETYKQQIDAAIKKVNEYYNDLLASESSNDRLRLAVGVLRDSLISCLSSKVEFDTIRELNLSREIAGYTFNIPIRYKGEIITADFQYFPKPLFPANHKCPTVNTGNKSDNESKNNSIGLNYGAFFSKNDWEHYTGVSYSYGMFQTELGKTWNPNFNDISGSVLAKVGINFKF